MSEWKSAVAEAEKAIFSAFTTWTAGWPSEAVKVISGVVTEMAALE